MKKKKTVKQYGDVQRLFTGRCTSCTIRRMAIPAVIVISIRSIRRGNYVTQRFKLCAYHAALFASKHLRNNPEQFKLVLSVVTHYPLEKFA